jgi:hypothetical protein
MHHVGSLAASVALTAVAVLVPSVPESAGRPSAPRPAPPRLAVLPATRELMQRLPLQFEANHGQAERGRRGHPDRGHRGLHVRSVAGALPGRATLDPPGGAHSLTAAVASAWARAPSVAAQRAARPAAAV